MSARPESPVSTPRGSAPARVAVAALVVVAAACTSTGDEAPAAPGTPDPCVVVVREDFAAVGLAVDPGRPRDADRARRCLYFYAGSNARVTVTVQDRTIGRRTFDASRELVPASAALAGIGDGAFWDRVTRSVHVRVGPEHLTVSTDGRATRDQLVALARTGALRMVR